MDEYITQEAADELGYIFVDTKHLDQWNFGAWWKPDVEALLNDLIGEKNYLLVGSDNAPNSRPGKGWEIWGDDNMGQYGDWETCNWLFVPDLEKRALAKLFFSK